MDVVLRLASPTDLETLLPLVRAYHEFEGLAIGDAQREAAVARLVADRTLGGIWLVDADGRLAGYLALCRGYSIEFGGFDAFVDEFYLSPEFRGRGVGRTVLGLIQTEAAALELGALHLEVARENARARRLYSSVGFEARERYLLMSLKLAR